MQTSPDYRIGVDGGGTGTRLRILDRRGQPLAQAEGGASTLARGSERAWHTILDTLERAFRSLGERTPALSRCEIGLGLAGVHNHAWAEEFKRQAPDFARLALATDGYTTLLGAHGGRPGVIVALGTGSIGEALYADGSHREVGGWGYPCGDEASGAWLGQRATQLTQMALDGRLRHSPLTRAVLAYVGGDWQAMMSWNSHHSAGQYAQLAPLVVRHAEEDSAAAELLRQAGRDAWAIAQALDPQGELPIALCGGLGAALRDWLPPEFRRLLAAPQGDSAQGALLLLQR